LADYGTRLKAVFNNVPTGVRLFVSTTNLSSSSIQKSSSDTTSTATTYSQPASGTATTTFAQLVVSEVATDGAGSVPALAPTGTLNSSAANITELSVIAGSATAVWEVITTNAAANETVTFGVWATFSANVPVAGTSTVNLSYAPTPPVFFSASSGAQASGSLTIPRFADTSTAKNILAINLCQTVLLFPYVTNQAGFDTGLAIANTSQDPLGTTTQTGTCTLTWYDGTGKTAPTPAFSVAPGTVYTNLTSVLAPGFQGYMFAVCNFQFAHGFAFISDLGARNLAMGYLALVVNSGSLNSRGPSAEVLAH